MSKELLEFLAEEVRKGNRPNHTFRTSYFVATAKVISENFQVNYTSDHVENHMKIVRNARVTISTLRNNSGFGWNDKLKMAIASPRAYATYVKYLNKKIDMYDEMAVVVGKDMTRGNFPKTFGDINPSVTIERIPSIAESGTSSDSKTHHKRSRNDEEGCDMGKIYDQLQVVSTLKQISNNQLDAEKLYEEIMKMDVLRRRLV
ncbi:L10-interacting MYB domain-containing protein [Bienertia sinuspersici]